MYPLIDVDQLAFSLPTWCLHGIRVGNWQLREAENGAII